MTIKQEIKQLNDYDKRLKALGKRHDSASSRALSTDFILEAMRRACYQMTDRDGAPLGDRAYSIMCDWDLYHINHPLNYQREHGMIQDIIKTIRTPRQAEAVVGHGGDTDWNEVKYKYNN